MVRVVKGDLLNSQCDVICHQVNCRGVMGAGLALKIKNKYPNVYKEYCDFCRTDRPDKLLGRVLISHVGDKSIANLFNQVNYGTECKQTDYYALGKTLKELRSVVPEDKTIGIPYNMGCGLAGGDWEVVFRMIKACFKNSHKVKIYKFI